MTDSKEDGLTISVEREDLEDGSITYHLWDTTNGDYKWIVGLNDDKAAQGGKSKFYAERIALAVNALSTPPKPVAGSKEDGLRFADLRRANVERQEHWGGSENWTLADWSNAVAGEVGEACNVVKKIRRPQLGTVGNDADAPKYYAQLESEIGDVLIYLDLLAKAAGFTLDTCVSRAFNEKSEKLGMPVRLSASSPPVGGSGEVDIDVDELAGEIRYVDGEHKLGAGALAEALAPYLRLVIRSALAAPVPNGVPEGFKLVPIEPTPDMLRAGMDDLGWWVEPYDAPRESGVPVETDISSEDAAKINAQQIEVIAATYRAMLAASPVTPEGVSGGDGWIEWKGRGRPAFDDDRVFIRQRGGSEFAVLAGTVKWSHDGRAHDIVAYRLAKTV